MSRFTPPDSTYRVAAIQYEPTLGEKEKNVRDLLALVEDAIRHDARLIILPEMATTGLCWVSREEIAPYTEPILGPTTEIFQHLASRYSCYIAIGLPEVDATTQAYYNSAVLLGPDGLVGTYRKLHSSITEPRWARDGDLGIPVWETPLGRLSALICMDATYFETARIAALQQADVLLLLANWPDERYAHGWWMARAFENALYIIAANRHGRERGIQFSGGSCVLNPDGTIQAQHDKGDGIVYGEVDLNRSRAKQWGSGSVLLGDLLADRRPLEYVSLLNNSYLWEPLRYHGLYDLGALPPGQLSCVGIVQMELQPGSAFQYTDPIQTLREMLQRMMHDNAPAIPDVLVLPELLFPGPLPRSNTMWTDEERAAHFRQGAIQVPGPETDALVALANDLQVSMVLGVAERADEDVFYNTVLLVDPEGVYGIYRKLHLNRLDRLWATNGNLGLPTFDIPAGRIALTTGYDALFPETLRVLANKGADLVCAPALLDAPDPVYLEPTPSDPQLSMLPDEEHPVHALLWRVRAAEHNVYLALANWYGEDAGIYANGGSGIFSPACATYPFLEVVAEEGEFGLMMMTIDTREQRSGRRTTNLLGYSPGDMAGSLTGELAYSILDSIPGNVVRSKPMLRKRQPFWYIDLVRR